MLSTLKRRFSPMTRWPAVACVFLLITALQAGAGERLESVVLQLAGKHQFQFAGYYAALAKGYYAEHGLDVTLVESGDGRFSRNAVVDGRAQYGIAGAELLLHRADGDPLVVLAPFFQHSPSILLTREDSGVRHPQHLIGKRVMLLPGKLDADILAVFLNENIALDAIDRIDQSYDLNDLIQGRADAVSAFVTNEPWYLQQAGIQPGTIHPSTYGVDFYYGCLFTTEQEVNRHPARVAGFLEASKRGWAYAMANQEEIIDLIINRYGVKSRDHLRYQARIMGNLILPRRVAIGHMNPGRWRHIADTFHQLGELPAGFDLDGFLYDPDPRADYTWVMWVFAAAGLVLLVMGALSMFRIRFNRKLTLENRQRIRTENKLRRSKEEYRSDRKRTEAALIESRRMFATLIANLPGIAFRCRIDHEWTMAFVSQGCREITGYSPDAFIENRQMAFNELIHPRDRQRVREEIQDALKKGDAYEIEYRIIRKDGQVRDIWEHGIRVISETGGPAALEGFISDITGRKRAEKEKEALQAQLRQAQKLESIGHLAGGIAHDFNNILASIIGFTELTLEDVEKGTSIEDNLQEVYTAGKRARDLVKQILAFARQSDEAVKPIQVHTIVKEVLTFIRSSLPATIDIRQRIESTSSIMGNAIQIHQVLMNLCTNAAHAMEDNGGILKVGLKDVAVHGGACRMAPDLPDGNYLELSVSDTGAGIEPEIIDSIFDPYFTTKGPGKGTGMGLAMVHGIVESYGGRVTVGSRPGSGTRVTVYLPATTRSSNETEYAPKVLPSGRERILFVDDEAPIARMASQILMRLGYRVETRTSSVEALERFRSGPDDFDLIITDMTMPNMAGDRMAVEAMRIRPDIPVIICTGYSKKLSERASADIGIRAIVHKPVVRAELAEAVRRVLDGVKPSPPSPVR